ncbi:MAG: STAS domain-containing protein [Clostridia bacterium]|nr:STAS domain-containing protein [Clostridia bacterium]
MVIEVFEEGSALTLVLHGRMDTLASPEFEDVIKSKLDGVDDLTFDFADVQYISSSGLRVLLYSQKEMDLRGGRMRLVKVSRMVSDIFDITGFSGILTIEKEEPAE